MSSKVYMACFYHLAWTLGHLFCIILKAGVTSASDNDYQNVWFSGLLINADSLKEESFIGSALRCFFFSFDN